MKTFCMIPGFLAGILATATVIADAPAAEPTDPSAASSPHQRQTVKKPAEEAPAVANTPSDAATPHQKQVMKKKHKKKSSEADTPSP